MKWIKASDNSDPGITKYYIVKWHTGADRVYIDSNTALQEWCDHNGIDIYEIEWLDESSTPIAATRGAEPLTKAINFAREKYYHDEDGKEEIAFMDGVRYILAQFPTKEAREGRCST